LYFEREKLKLQGLSTPISALISATMLGALCWNNGVALRCVIALSTLEQKGLGKQQTQAYKAPQAHCL